MTRVYSCLVALLLAPSCFAGAGEQLEPCYQFEIEESFGPIGGPARKRKQVCFTDAELPWASMNLVPEAREKLEGFTAQRKDANLAFGAKIVKGQKVVWTRKRGEAANIKASTVRLSVSPEVPTPAFTLDFGRGPKLRVPAGCLGVEVVPHKAGAAGIDDFELKNTCSATGALSRAVFSYEMGDRTITACNFNYATTSSEGTRKTTLLLSREVPGGLCSMSIEMDDKRRGKVKGSIRIVKMIPAPIPEGLEEFKEAGFAFAPPEGYSRAKEAKAGETVRYVTDKGAFIAVVASVAPKGGLRTLWEKTVSKDDGGGSSMSRAHHLAGHRTFDTWDEKTEVGCIHAEHAGRVYRVSVSNLGNLRPAEAAALLRGWRWLAAVGGADTPQAAYAAFQKAIREEDNAKLLKCLTPDSQDTVVGDMVVKACLPVLLAKDLGGKVRPELTALLDKHGLDASKATKKASFAVPASMVKDKVTFMNDIMKLYRDLNKTHWLSVLVDTKLSDVGIEGDTATGKLSDLKGRVQDTTPIGFRKVDGKWLVHIRRPEPPKNRVGPPPEAE